MLQTETLPITVYFYQEYFRNCTIWTMIVPYHCYRILFSISAFGCENTVNSNTLIYQKWLVRLSSKAGRKLGISKKTTQYQLYQTTSSTLA